jgi:hypothetical protein
MIRMAFVRPPSSAADPAWLSCNSLQQRRGGTLPPRLFPLRTEPAPDWPACYLASKATTPDSRAAQVADYPEDTFEATGSRSGLIRGHPQPENQVLL